MAMSLEDIQNLTSWLQAILKEVQESRGAALEMREHIKLIPEIRDSTHRGTQDSGDAERKIEETRNHLENKIDRLEHSINDIKSTVQDIKNKVDRLK